MKSIILALGLSFPLLAHAYKVIGIADGATLTLLVDQKLLKIRLANIDPPEREQAFGERSRLSLSDLCWGKDASYDMQDIDRDGRIVAVVTCGGVPVNWAQVESGMAWVYERYNKDKSLLPVQARARKDRKGLWADANPVPPWEFRKQKRNDGNP